jgi:hypothetical protein
MTLASMLALLPDNTTGEIGADDMRTIVTELFDRTDGEEAVNAIQFSTTPTIPGVHTPGHMHWNTTEGVAEIMTGTDGVTLQLGHEQYAEVRNTSGSTILNGRPVRVTGASGSRATIGLDNGQGAALGVMTHDIANNSNGKVTTFGLVRDVNTSAFSDGAAVFASSTGTLTTTLTSSFIGYVLLAHPTNGIVFVSPDSRVVGSGTTAQRPTTVTIGFMYFDTTLGIPIFWNGTGWRNASGGVV